MTSQKYHMPEGLHVIPNHLLDLRPDAEVDHDLLNPKPMTDEKNVWFFWHSGFENMHPYTQRNVRAWHRRFTKYGWVIRVLNRQESSPLNIANFLDVTDPETFPKSFIDGTIGGDYAPQHTSDLARWPLLLKYGGVYTDVGLMQIGDLDRLWRETVANPSSPYEVASYNCGGADEYDLANHFLVSCRNNPLFERCHRLLLAIWAEDGGKSSTDGMRLSKLLKGVKPLGVNLGEKTSAELTDYIIQGQVMRMVMLLIDDETGWHGPKYVTEHVFGIEYMIGAQLINELTAWDGHKAFELMSLSLPEEGEKESAEQAQARVIVERCLSESFGFKLAHGMIIKVLGETLGSLWRSHDGSDVVPGTYADWLRYGMVYWNQDQLPAPLGYELLEAVKTGPLLRES